jgi:hypothetical protein
MAPTAASPVTSTIYLPLVAKSYPQIDPPALGWATGPEGVLLRWRWPHSRTPAPTSYRIYRDDALLATAQRVTDETQAMALLGGHWPWLQTTYDVSTIAELHAFLDDNPLAELWLADQRYPVALVRGLGYLDDTAALGSTHTYRVVAELPGGSQEDMGTVEVPHTGITPLDAPTGLHVVQVVSDTLRGSPDWARVQKNRKADSKVFLRWDLPEGTTEPPPTWVTSYDVFRATAPGGPYQRINVEDGEDRPVVPMANYEPPSEPGDPPYERYDHYYADADPALQACQRYYYRVAPRDLLGRPRDWSDPAQRPQFSDYVEAVPPDTIPPAPPQGLKAEPDHLAGKITLTWDSVADAARYHVYRSTTTSAGWPGVADCISTPCWVTMTTTTATTWVDTSATYEQRYWYVVRAEDAPCSGDPPNLSAPSQPVSAILHDRTPPGRCTVEGSQRKPTIYVSCPTDTADVLLFCRFDGGPELLVTKGRTNSLTYDLSEFYTPAKPIKADCRAVAMDKHGNRSVPSNWVSGLPLTPPSVPDPSPPILLDITTSLGGVHGWTANLTWDAIGAPCLTGFRVYRQAASDPAEILVADESVLGPDKRSYADDEVMWGTVYTYTVAAYRAPGDCGPDKEVPSQPMVYRVTQPPEYPGRVVDLLEWYAPYYDAAGTHLTWRTRQKLPLYVVFRSLRPDRGYVAITPPIQSSSYLDTDAHHENYWYMVVALDPVTGEPFAATVPWSAGVTETRRGREQEAGRQGEGETGREGDGETEGQEIEQLPGVLRFGDGFELHVTRYDRGSTMEDLSGEGELYLYPDGELLPVALSFEHLQATWKDQIGVVTSGSVTVPGDALPIELTPDDGFRYEVTSLTVDPDGGSGSITLYLPASIYYRWVLPPPFPPIEALDDHIYLDDATIHPELTFQRVATSSLTCSLATSTYFRLEDLPWRVIPTGVVTYTQSSIAFESGCALYHERYTGTRPGAGEPDANDGLLRAQFESSDARIDPDGLSGTFSTTEMVNYTVPFPYGFHLKLRQPRLKLDGGFIVGGQASNIGGFVEFEYFQHVAETDPYNPPWPPDTPEGTWWGSLTGIEIGQGGSIHAVATLSPIAPDVSWLNGGFVLHDHRYELYVSPLQSTRWPWVDALWPAEEYVWEDGTTVEPGLNLRTAEGESADLEWNDCSTAGPITFPEGVKADLYLRRPGVSDLLQATIPLGSPMSVELDGYQTRLQSFLVVFFDNTIYDRDISGSFYLPNPSDALIPFYDANLDESGCIASANVSAVTLEPAYWVVTMHPTSLEFRPPDPDPAWPGERGLWLIGGVDVPHMAPPGSTDPAAIPLETAFKPNGDFYGITLQYDEVNYIVDGFPFLLGGVRLSDWPTRETPGWDAAATLNDPPGCCSANGFVELNGNLVAPVFGTLVEKGGDDPPRLFVLGWDDYIGFSKQARAERTWTVITEISWGFDLLYAHHHSEHRGLFVGFRSDDLKVVEMDQALVLNSATGGDPRADILLGLSSGTGLLRALAEVTQPSLPENFDDIRPTVENWRSSRFSGIDEDYVDLLDTIWSSYDSDGYTETTEKIDALGDEDIPEDPSGGGTKGKLDEWGIKLKKMRGDVAWTQDTNTGDWDFEEMRISLWFDVKRESDDAALVHADRLTFYITRDGDYVLEGMGITSKVFKYEDLTIDFIVAVNVNAPSVEAGLTLHNLDVEVLVFENVGAVFGVGQDIFYLGALADVTFDIGAGSVSAGGAFLFGQIDPGSIVLRNMGFDDLLDNLGATGETGALAGGYVRVYADVPIYNYSCLFRVSVGGEVAVWYFAQVGGDCSAYGGRLRGYVYGKILCVVSARGDLTLEIYRKLGPSPGECAPEPSMYGQFWVAGGIGFCSPESWHSWESRWWGDSWCWTCGAMVEANYNDTNPGDWWWNYEADYE